MAAKTPKRTEPKNPITGVRLDPKIRKALDAAVAEMNKKRDLSSGHGEITVAGLIRGWVYRFLIEEGKLDKQGNIKSEA
jgi:hypothetical protein